jgi:alpha-N-arabinofuranosidase
MEDMNPSMLEAAMLKATVTLDRDFNLGQVDKRLYGSFIEHLGRAVYGGIYEPGHPQADAQGFRRDVVALVRELGVPVMRYPGGNFVSGYDWRDGIGPRAGRPRRAEQAWSSIETNQIGIDEFADWCRLAGTEMMLAVNLGTLGPDEARQEVEYCNMAGGTYWSDLRVRNGHREPHNVKLWCLGNEMDGPWQICHKTAGEYGRAACEAAKVMKWADPSIEVVACGSSNRDMPTFAEWERVVLEHAYEHIDYISLHQYYGRRGDMASFLAEGVGMDRFIKEIVSACDFVRAKQRHKKEMMLSFDEWNVWFHSSEADREQERWQVAPPILEDKYDMADALVVGTMLNALVRNAGRVKVACLAQLVNVIAPIMTRNGGPAWRQTIYWPFLHASLFGRGLSLGGIVDSPRYDAKNHAEVPYLDVSAVLDEEKGEAAVFMVNRSEKQAMDVRTDLRGVGGAELLEHIVLRHDDLSACNTEDDPDNVSPKFLPGGSVRGGVYSCRIPAASWNVVRFAVK